MKCFSFILFFSTTLFGNAILSSYDNRFDAPLWTKSAHFSLQDTLTKPEDSTLIQIYPARALVRSLVLPGWGQMYNKSPWWKIALFAGIEVVGIVGIVQFNKKGEDLRLKYEDFADQHWSFENWINDTPIDSIYWQNGNVPYYFDDPEIYNDKHFWDVTIEGAHSITIWVNGVSMHADTLRTDPGSSLLGSAVVQRDRNYYENIGKYDQFVCGWDDVNDFEKKEKKTEDISEILIMTKNREKYLDMRYESNTYLKRATYTVSALMFNHVISTLEAVWTSQSNARKKKPYDTSMGLFYNKNSKYGIGGLSVAISW